LEWQEEEEEEPVDFGLIEDLASISSGFGSRGVFELRNKTVSDWSQYSSTRKRKLTVRQKKMRRLDHSSHQLLAQHGSLTSFLRWNRHRDSPFSGHKANNCCNESHPDGCDYITSAGRREGVTCKLAELRNEVRQRDMQAMLTWHF
jgi:hypothetical protein